MAKNPGDQWKRLDALRAEETKLLQQRTAIETRLAALRKEAAPLVTELRRHLDGNGTSAAPAATPKPSKPAGTFTDQVLSHVKGQTDAPTIAAKLGLKGNDQRRRVYKVLDKAAQAKRIKKLGDGKFAPR